MALVEVVAPRAADPGVVAAATGLVTDWGKTAVRTADAPGFIVNRVNRPFTLEALALLEAGTGSVASIDLAVRSAGFPMGPFELMDLVGIDVNLAAARAIFEAIRYEPRFRPSAIQERLVEAGRFGRKSGEGFYWYGEDGRLIGVAGAFAAVDDPGSRGPSGPRRARPSRAGDRRPPRPPCPTRSSSGSSWRSSTRPTAPSATASRARRTSTSPCGSGPAIRRGPFEWVAELGGRRGRPGAGSSAGALAGPRFDPAPALVEAATGGR